MFTAALLLPKEFRRSVFVSDNTDHSKNTIIVYLYKILLQLPRDVKELYIWSDGPTAQFKNKYIAAAIVLFEELFPIKIVWNFFATSHGKGCVDGLGAVAKHRVKRMVLSRKAVVNCATDFVEAFNSEFSSVKVEEVSESEIATINSDLESDFVFSNAKKVPKITSFHRLQVENGELLGFPRQKTATIFFLQKQSS